MVLEITSTMLCVSRDTSARARVVVPMSKAKHMFSVTVPVSEAPDIDVISALSGRITEISEFISYWHESSVTPLTLTAHFLHRPLPPQGCSA